MLTLGSVAVELPIVAIAGNPNSGKTTLFNGLTGSHQKVGNYPGVTVEKVTARLKLDGREVEFVDVPGLYSLEPVSEDEIVAVGVLEGEYSKRPDLVVCVVNAANLERNLFFYSQLAEAGYPLLIALTMVDLVETRQQKLDLARLSELLRAEIVPVVGHKEKRLDKLKAAVARNLASPRIPGKLGSGLEEKTVEVSQRLARSGIDATTSEIVEALQDPHSSLDQSLVDTPELEAALDDARRDLTAPSLTASQRYSWANQVVKEVVSLPAGAKKNSREDRIDYFLTHRVFGLIIFFGLMYLVFQSIYTFAAPLMDLIESGFGWIGDVVGGWLSGSPVIKDLVVSGLIGGVGGMLVFLPQILILFFFIAVLEGSGYLARAAFLMDRLLGWCGLNGRAFIPMLSSFACAIPGIMSARVMPDKKSRLATIMVSPLMSCSARLPVYMLLIGAFIQPKFGSGWAGFTLFAMHLLGLLVAIPVVYFLNRGVIKGKRLPFALELPPYQLPKWRDVWLSMYFRGKVFVYTAGTIIVVMSVIIWALSYFPRSDEADVRYRTAYVASHPGAEEDAISKHVEEERLAHSVLGGFGKAIEPVFRPAGFDWRITTSILSAFPARETVVPSLGIIFSVGDNALDDDTNLRTELQRATWPDGRPLMDPWTAVGLMVFFALCAQCMATLATVKRETNSWKWPLFMFTYMTGLAYIGAVLVHQLGRMLGN